MIVVIDRCGVLNGLQKEMASGIGDMGLDRSAVWQADMGIRAGADRQRQVAVTELANFALLVNCKKTAQMGSSQRINREGLRPALTSSVWRTSRKPGRVPTIV